MSAFGILEVTGGVVWEGIRAGFFEASLFLGGSEQTWCKKNNLDGVCNPLEF